MAYVPTKKDFEGFPIQKGESSYIPTAEDFEGIPDASTEPVSQVFSKSTRTPFEAHAHDWGAEMVNPWINMINLIPHAHIKPIQPYDPSSLAAIGGQLEGQMLPFLTGEGAIVRGASLLPKLAESLGLGEKAVSPLAKLAGRASSPSIARSAAAGALSGGLTAPSGNREQSAALSAALAGTGHFIGDLAAGFFHEIPMRARVKKAASLYRPPITGEPEDALTDTTNEIASNYLKDLDEARGNFNPIFKEADAKKIGFTKADLPAYSSLYKELGETKSLPLGAKAPEVLGSLANPASLWDIHELQSKLGTHSYRSKLSGNGIEAAKQKDLQKSLLQDLSQKLEGESPDLAERYQGARSFFKNKIGPYRSHAAFKKMVKAIETLPKEEGVPADKLFQLNWHGNKPSSLLSNLIPGVNDKDMSALHSFQNDLMGGDKAKTSQLAKNLLFSKYASPLNGPLEPGEIETPDYKFNMQKFLNHYKGITSKKQLAYLFNPEEKAVLDKFAPHANKLKKPNAISTLGKKALGTALGYLVGGHLGAGNPMAKAAGEVAGAVLASPAEAAAQQITKKLLPNTLEDLLSKMGTYSPSVGSTQGTAALGAALAQTLENPGGL